MNRDAPQRGRMIAVVGPSGVGKDSVMAGIKAALPDIHLVQRVVTRAPGLGGEDYRPATVAEFEAMVAEAAFAVHWGAHGLYYGIPGDTLNVVAAGTDCLANFSRSALTKGAEVFERFTVLNITARPETLAQRLANRGRETPEDIQRRLAQIDKPLPEGLDVIHLSNDGALAQTIARAVQQLAHESMPS